MDKSAKGARPDTNSCVARWLLWISFALSMVVMENKFPVHYRQYKTSCPLIGCEDYSHRIEYAKKELCNGYCYMAKAVFQSYHGIINGVENWAF